MIVAVTPIVLTYRTETSMPELMPSEMGLTMDSGRMVIGHDPKFGQKNFSRTIFPQQRIEAITEMSPRNWELFRDNIRDQDRHSYFEPTIVPVKVGAQAVTFQSHDGGFHNPLEIDGDHFSALIEYQVYQSDQLVKLGSLRILPTPNPSPQTQEFIKIGDNSALTFAVGVRKTLGVRTFYPVTCTNLTTGPLTLLIRKTVVDPTHTSFTPLLPPKPNYSADLG